jgi:hypothetical protein
MTYLQHGYVQIAGTKIFALPENYQIISKGNKSNIIPRIGESLFDPGYGFLGFSIRGKLIGQDTGLNIISAAQNALQTATPLLVSDTLYPGGRSWVGFIELPVIFSGQTFYNGLLNVPKVIDDISLTFYSSTPELL